ncbi:MAG: DMT family transporter [Cyclobacteriaceae bacterium]|nr:DMT family transporter [Cyclobacteriaceae bacterium HetDA_MAG_MS6]
MNQLLIYLLAFVGGVFLAIQGGFNAQLGVLLKNPLLASMVAFATSSIYVLVSIMVSVRALPTTMTLKAIPTHLWFIGGFCSFIGIALYYYTIPKLGIANMISLGLSGQLIFSILASHFGWFDLPLQTIDYRRVIGVGAMILGIFLINSK